MHKNKMTLFAVILFGFTTAFSMENADASIDDIEQVLEMLTPCIAKNSRYEAAMNQGFVRYGQALKLIGKDNHRAWNEIQLSMFVIACAAHSSGRQDLQELSQQFIDSTTEQLQPFYQQNPKDKVSVWLLKKEFIK